MTSNERIERSVSVWLREDAAFRVPDHLDEVLAVTRETRQRPVWSSLERWLPVDTTFRPRLFSVPRAGRLAMVAALLLLVFAIAILAVGSYQQRLPEPFGLARNGLFVTSNDGELYLIDPATSERRLLPLGEAFDFSPIFSRDGTKLVFLRSDGPLTEPAILTMMIGDADGSNVRAVTPPTKSLDWFDWSPDGTRIAYMATGTLHVVDVAGGEPVRFTDAGRMHFPTWLPPDGKDIVFRQETRNPGIYAIAADGSGPRRLLSTTPANNEFDYQSIAVAPDGRHVTFTRWDSTTDPWTPGVYALDVATGEEMRFPTLAGTGLRGSAPYSPDGTSVAYARVYPDGAFELVVANADGSGNERVIGPKKPAPTDGSSIPASWAFTPDGTALIVRYGDDDAAATQLMPLDGSPPTEIEGSGGLEFVDVQRLAP
jgi:Tol biopolymer transport system component